MNLEIKLQKSNKKIIYFNICQLIINIYLFQFFKNISINILYNLFISFIILIYLILKLNICQKFNLFFFNIIENFF